MPQTKTQADWYQRNKERLKLKATLRHEESMASDPDYRTKRAETLKAWRKKNPERYVAQYAKHPRSVRVRTTPQEKSPKAEKPPKAIFVSKGITGNRYLRLYSPEESRARLREQKRDYMRRAYLKKRNDPIAWAEHLAKQYKCPYSKLAKGRYRARQRGAVGTHSLAQWHGRVSYYAWRCFYCRVELTAETLTKDHRIPLSKGGSDWAANLVPACQRCNCSKSDRPLPKSKFPSIL
jgi:5-methylcytosine-specific restriction endonuclease McrA